jgi:hypothetical protein
MESNKKLRNLVPKLNAVLQHLCDNIFCTLDAKNCHLVLRVHYKDNFCEAGAACCSCFSRLQF